MAEVKELKNELKAANTCLEIMAAQKYIEIQGDVGQVSNYITSCANLREHIAAAIEIIEREERGQ